MVPSEKHENGKFRVIQILPQLKKKKSYKSRDPRTASVLTGQDCLKLGSNFYHTGQDT